LVVGVFVCQRDGSEGYQKKFVEFLKRVGIETRNSGFDFGTNMDPGISFCFITLQCIYAVEKPS